MNTNNTINPLETGADELERLALEAVIKRRRLGNPVSVLVIPAADSALAIAMAKLGCQVSVGDEPAVESRLNAQILSAGLGDGIVFVPFDFSALADDLTGEPFDLIVLRRGICNIPYEAARQLIRRLMLRLKIGGKLYLSILGLHSELGDGYPGADEPLGGRFSELDSRMAAKYDIHRPVCLYSERNLFTLLLEAGGSVLRTFTSTHGNVKGIAVRV